MGGGEAGPPIDKVLFNVMLISLTEKLPKEKLDALQRDYLRLENCPDLVAPKINKQIWQQLKQDTKKHRFFPSKSSSNIDVLFVGDVAKFATISQVANRTKST